ncbi:MAG: outer membrane protein assembly factor BamD [Hyphomicrobiaceae bacterium]
MERPTKGAIGKRLNVSAGVELGDGSRYKGTMMAFRTMSKKAGARMACALFVAAALVGCASSNDMTKALNPDPPGKMYAEADAFMSKGYYDEAAKRFEELDRDHPYATEARRAMVMAAYAYYKGGKYPEAIASARRYTTLHPGSKDAALAHHVIASSYFDQIKDPAHDQTAARRALAELRVVVSRYPESPYARQAENRIRISEDSIAASEMNVGRYYLRKAQYVAAINRFKTVVAEYQTTQHVEEALHRLVEANVALGIIPEAQSAAAVLGYNYPNSKWYKDSFALLQKQGVKPQHSEGSWITQQWKKIAPGGSAPKPAPASQQEPQQPNSPVLEPLPPEREPAVDIPTASTTRSPRPMGLTSLR